MNTYNIILHIWLGLVFGKHLSIICLYYNTKYNHVGICKYVTKTTKLIIIPTYLVI